MIDPDAKTPAPQPGLRDWPVGLLTAATDGAILTANAAAAALLEQLGPSPACGDLFKQLRAVAPDLRPALAQARARGGRLERMLRNGDAAATLTAICEHGAVTVVLVDESARIRAEAEAARARARFSALADAMPGGAAFSLDCRGRVNGWSRSAERFEGLSAPEALGLTLDALFARAHFPAGAQTLVEAAGLAGEASVSGLRCGPDAAPAWITLTLRAVRDRKGALDGFVALVRDDAGGSVREAELRRLAGSDPLTGVLNRRAFEEAADAALAAAARRGDAFALALFDLDDLKGLNDRHGHGAGDAALRALADAARETLRGGDLIGRLGGDEFAVALPGADERHARIVCERLRATTARLRPDSGGRVLRFTASFGYAAATGPNETLARLFDRADAALYRAKAAGRDAVAAAA